MSVYKLLEKKYFSQTRKDDCLFPSHLLDDLLLSGKFDLLGQDMIKRSAHVQIPKHVCSLCIPRVTLKRKSIYNLKRTSSNIPKGLVRPKSKPFIIST